MLPILKMLAEMVALSIIKTMDASKTLTETNSRVMTLQEWQALDWGVRRKLGVQHLRDTHYSNPFYKAKADSHSDPMEYWNRLWSSCVNMIPPTARVPLKNSSTLETTT
jgi:hypothetical protein